MRSLINLSIIAGLILPVLASAQTQTLPQGWSMVGNGASIAVDAAVIFGNSTSPTSNSSSVITVWSWNNLLGRWNFLAPSMTAQELSTYAASKGYGVLSTIAKGEGFWVNAKNAFLYDPSITASPTNAAPVANAGVAQNVFAGSGVTLDGGASSDANSDPLSYTWTLTTKPAGSVAVLSSATSAKPTFTADVAGTYVASLSVNDGKVNSTTTSVSITAALPNVNVAPVANAGPPQTVSPGFSMTPSMVRIDGSKSSDANGDVLTYVWSLTSKPSGSAAVIANPTGAVTTFLNDGPGVYVATLIVSDGVLSSVPSTVSISAQTTLSPVIDAGPDQVVSALSKVTLDGSRSYDPTGIPLASFWWQIARKPLGSTATILNPSQSIASFVPDIVGDYSVTLDIGATRGNGISYYYPPAVTIKAQ